ncbi:MAG: hypothetical protein IKT33_02045 [Clostridia bacterium]|nr:hypothetical protein [Clostridia bacterium]
MQKNRDLLWIKNKYGEEMMDLCRRNFVRILEFEGLLSQLLQKYFMRHRTLARDIITQCKEDDFKEFIYSKVDIKEDKVKVNTDKSAKELFEQAGYILYPECKTEEEIQSFRHYYYRPYTQTPEYHGGIPEVRMGEELCTFNGGRLKLDRVWFAVKKDVDKIHREDFKKPIRQDAYGTSVISIQFTKGKYTTLSIKNRYNHSVINPDNTFNNNLDNIIAGLSDAFERDFGVRDKTHCGKSNFELEGYTLANDGKFYPYNYEINNIYYCPNNIVIENFRPKQLPTHQLLVDYYVIDFKTNTINLYDKTVHDTFVDNLSENTRIILDKNGLLTIIKADGETVVLKINKYRQIVGLEDKTLEQCGNNYMRYNRTLKSLILPKLKRCGYDFMRENNALVNLDLSSLEECEYSFLYENNSLKTIELPNLKKCGDYFMCRNIDLEQIYADELLSVGDGFMFCNLGVQKISFGKLRECKNQFFAQNTRVNEVHMPELEQCGHSFMAANEELRVLTLEKLRKCGSSFLVVNQCLEQANLMMLEDCKESFLHSNKALKYIYFPRLKECGHSFIHNNEIIERIYLPALIECSNYFLSANNAIVQACFQSLKECGDGFMRENTTMKKIEMPNLDTCWDDFMYKNEVLVEAYFPRLSRCSDNFLYNNRCMRVLDLPQLYMCGKNFIPFNRVLSEINLQWLHSCGDQFLLCNDSMKFLMLPWLEKCGHSFMRYNTTLKNFYAPLMEDFGRNSLINNKNLKPGEHRTMPRIDSGGYGYSW